MAGAVSDFLTQIYPTMIGLFNPPVNGGRSPCKSDSSPSSAPKNGAVNRNRLISPSLWGPAISSVPTSKASAALHPPGYALRSPPPGTPRLSCPRRQPLEGLQVYIQCLQVAIVDADDTGI